MAADELVDDLVQVRQAAFLNRIGPQTPEATRIHALLDLGQVEQVVLQEAVDLDEVLISFDLRMPGLWFCSGGEAAEAPPESQRILRIAR